MTYLNLDLEEIFSFNSFVDGVIGFFSGILKIISDCSNFGIYLKYFFSDNDLKKYFTILSSKKE